MESLSIGDRVTVNNIQLMSYGCIGTIIDFPKCYPNSVIVRFDNWCNEGEKRLYIKKENLQKGNKNMNTLKGNYKIALVKFVQGTNTCTPYAFALFDEGIEKDDYVLCDTARGYNVAKVVEVKSQADYDGGVTVTKEIVCKLDFTTYEKRQADRKRKESLKKRMDKMLSDNQELVLYKALAEVNPEMKALLEEYQGLE